MKRPCTPTERELLLKNRNQLLKGIYQTRSKGSYSAIFVGLFFSIVIMFAGIFPLVEIFDGEKIAFWLWVIFSFTVGKMKVKKETKAFLKKDNLCVNGATIVDVNPTKGTFSYIEDDFLGENGSPIIVEYPALPNGFSAADVGRRLLVMYDSDSTYELMQINEELGRMIPAYTDQYPLKKELYAHFVVPHPNAARLDFFGHALSEEEKERYADKFVAVTQGGAGKTLKICAVIIFVCIMVISVILGITGDCLAKALLIGAAVYIGLMLLILLARKAGKTNLKKTASFVYMQEVVFHSNEIHQRGKYVDTSMKVYEWKNNQFELVTYPAAAMPQNTPYGSVVYKFTNQKGKFIFMKKD